MKKILYILLITCSTAGIAQKEKAPLWEGNNLYKKKDFQKSLEAYNKALSIAPGNPLANYNMGNTQFRLNQFEEAEKMYDNTIANSTDKSERAKAFYNKGVALGKQKKIDESIAAYKEALKLNVKDQETRENLQKALLEKKEEDKQNKSGNENDKKDGNKDKDKNKQDKSDKKKDDKNQEEEKDEQDKPKEEEKKQSKLSKQQVEQLLKSLEQKEKEVQKKIQENQKKKEEEEKNRSGTQPAKDW